MRSRAQYEDPPIPEETHINTERDQDEPNDKSEEPASQETTTGATEPPPKVRSEVPLYIPPHRYAPFPSRLNKKNEMDEKHFNRFLEILKQLHVNLPLSEVITQMPMYAKFFNDILSNRRKLEEVQQIELNSNGSALIRNELPEKLYDPGKFLSPVLLGK